MRSDPHKEQEREAERLVARRKGIRRFVTGLLFLVAGLVILASLVWTSMMDSGGGPPFPSASQSPSTSVSASPTGTPSSVSASPTGTPRSDNATPTGTPSTSDSAIPTGSPVPPDDGETTEPPSAGGSGTGEVALVISAVAGLIGSIGGLIAAVSGLLLALNATKQKAADMPSPDVPPAA